MTVIDSTKWRELNDRYIMAAVGWVHALLRERAEELFPPVHRPKPKKGFWAWLFGEVELEPISEEPHEPKVSVAEAAEEMKRALAALSEANALSTLAQVSQRFSLTPSEEKILLLCLAFELNSKAAWLCGIIQDKPSRPYPTFGLAMTLFRNHDWSSLPPERPLRKFRLIELRQPASTPLFGAELQLQETTLHYLRGIPSLDSRLTLFTSPLEHDDEALSTSQAAAVDRIYNAITERNVRVVQLICDRALDAERVARGVAAAFQWKLFATSLDKLPASPTDSDEFAHIWQRESSLFHLALMVNVLDVGSTDRNTTPRTFQFISQIQSPVLVITNEKLDISKDECYSIEILGPTVHEQFAMWHEVLPRNLPEQREFSGELSRQFTMDRSIARAAVTKVEFEGGQETTPQKFKAELWSECCRLSRPSVDGLAQRIDVKATLEDIVLSEDRKALLLQIRNQVQSRWRVYDQWGVASRMNRGLGISALFAGESGTGKTMAAEVLANELKLDLFRVDLSSVVNKYIGETEKHLRKLFDAFESCGAILFFDECDALFGKRGEVRDSHDRYANIEINYLLQRLESYRGLAILATNNRNAIDGAFMRRLRFVVNFDLPSEQDREKIWRKTLPPWDSASLVAIPIEALDYERLARFKFSGGSIHSIALNAAFRAASRVGHNRVSMTDVLSACRDEYVKQDRPINDQDFVFEPSAGTEAA